MGECLCHQCDIDVRDCLLIRKLMNLERVHDEHHNPSVYRRFQIDAFGEERARELFPKLMIRPVWERFLWPRSEDEIDWERYIFGKKKKKE